MKIIDLTDSLPKHKTKRYKTRPLSDIKALVVHHSATKTGTPLAFANYHVKQHGWPGIGYAYVISKGGKVFKCNPLSTITYHVGSSNPGSVGICLVGDYNSQLPPKAQIDALVELIREIQAAFPHKLEVKRHQDCKGYSWKKCPGEWVGWQSILKQVPVV